MFDLISIIQTVGYIGLFGIVFAESGLLIGFFLPGDSLLFTAGFLASQGYLNIWWLILVLFLAAVLGDNFGYSFGRRVGPRIFKREDSIFFHRENIVKAQKFFEAHGKKTIIIARFLPIIRTFAPILAGVGKMEYKVFLIYNLIGGTLWTISLTLLGYFLGNIIPNVDKYILPIIAVIIIVSFLPGIISILKDADNRKKLISIFKK